MPCRALWWLVDPETTAPVVLLSLIPVESDSLTEASEITTPVVHPSTSTPLTAEPIAVTWSKVTVDDPSARNPAKFCQRAVKPLTTTPDLEVAVTPKDCAPASTWWPVAGFAPPVST